MKNLIYVFVLSFFSTAAFSQGIIEREYSQYLDQDEVTHVYISGKMFDFASVIAGGVEDEEVKELSEFASKIESFSLIKVPNKSVATTEFKKGKQSIANQYEELMRVRESDTRFAIYVDEEDNVVYEIVGLGIVDGEFIALSLVGEMDLNKISEFISKVDNETLAPLKRMGEFNPDEIKVYPNPVGSNNQFTVDLPESMIGGTITVFSAKGEKMKSIDAKSRSNALSTDGLSSGSYFVEIQKESITMKKQLIVLQ